MSEQAAEVAHSNFLKSDANTNRQLYDSMNEWDTLQLMFQTPAITKPYFSPRAGKGGALQAAEKP